jgi:ATP-binding cassette subfamily F protein uup
MPLLRIRNLRLGYGGPPLLDGVNLVIEAGERVCLVGHNGSGKSTLLQVIEGRLHPEEGEIERQQGLRIAALHQQLPDTISATVFDCVAGGLGQVGQLMRRFHQLSCESRLGEDSKLLQQLEATQHELESLGGWALEQRVETVLSRLSLNPDARCEQLSGGVQRRALLARALVSEPDLLLLDEPTNHLDVQTIEWLEEFLDNFAGTLLFVSHDRDFLDKLATRIVDLDRGRINEWPGNYADYRRRKQTQLETEAAHWRAFDKRLAQEENWVRQGIKARRTRNEGRVRALQEMREQRRARRDTMGTARLRAQHAEHSGKLLIQAENASYSVAGQTLIRGLTTTILRGDKVGIIGPNGIGKTTLLRLLLGDLTPDGGHMRRSDSINPAYFDQRRVQLDLQRSVIDNLSDGRQFIQVNSRQRHVISYLQDFLFSPQRCQTPVAALSGGERNRLLLAKLFSKPANLLVLDEPTNDLDMETLDLLEDLLVAYEGTVLLVSHDRRFLDQVVTSTLVFEGDGVINEHIGGYADWLRQRRRPEPVRTKSAKPATVGRNTMPAPRGNILAYREQRELEQLPGQIEELEAEIAELTGRMSAADFYRSPGETIAQAKQRLADLHRALHEAFQRWEKLEQRESV